jgi:aryl carrier-like protein
MREQTMQVLQSHNAWFLIAENMIIQGLDSLLS